MRHATKSWLRQCVWTGLALIGSLGPTLSWGPTLAWGNGLGATPADRIQVPDGFAVDLVYEVPGGEEGSWVNMTVDPQGRLIASDQYGALYRITTAEGDETKVEKLKIDMGMAQGLLCAFDSLYVMVNAYDGNNPSGLYRLRDVNGDDQYESKELLVPLIGGGEHGPHAIVLSPDGKSLYFCGGNNTDIPSGIAIHHVPRNWNEDHLLGRMPDAGGHNVGRLAPGGFVCKVDPDGKNIELIATGFRNEYDIAFNPSGELFSYDADMEWDVGLPWYRPTRVNHVVSGAEFGWRNGSGKWPAYYADSLGAAVDIGPGSPTGICFGTGTKFPAKYQQALFICDWSYGNIHAVHLTPSGATYGGSFEAFATGSPLAVTDVVAHPQQGCLYFTTGGRRTQSALYRVRYTGSEPIAPAAVVDSAEAIQARTLRKQLEMFHGSQNAVAVGQALPQLAHPDRNIRFAARIALEHQPVAKWRDGVLAIDSPTGRIIGIIALARCGQQSDQPAAIDALLKLDWNKLNQEDRLALLRAYALVTLRLEKPSPQQREAILAQIDSQLPNADPQLDRELTLVLVALNAPKVVDRVVQRMQQATSQEEAIFRAFALREVRDGWTAEGRRGYFKWFQDAANARGGHSFGGYVENIRKAAIEMLDEAQQKELADVLAPPVARDPMADAAPRTVVKQWALADLEPALNRTDYKPDLERGKQMFAVAQCYKCHLFRGEGGILGPNLTAASGRFAPKDMLESILQPSKEVSDQYASSQFVTTDGQVITGKVVNLAGDTLMVMTNMLDPDAMTNIQQGDIESTQPSTVSMMPTGLLDTLAEEEILDLLAYIRSGNPAVNSTAQQ
jgi:putative heme-binding domain-containing protein